MTTEFQLGEIFSGLEENHEIFEPMIGNIPIWVLIKGNLPSFIVDLQMGIPPLPFLRRVYKDKLALARMFHEYALGYLEWQGLLKNFRKQSTSPVVMAMGYGVYREPLSDGRFKSFFFDDIFLSINRSFELFVIEYNGGTQRVAHSVGPRHLRAEYLMLPGYLGARAFQLSRATREKVRILSELISRKLSAFPDIQHAVELYFDTGAADRSIYRFAQLKRRAIPIIDHIRPSAILVIGSPGWYGVLSAAKERHIPIMEMQHGLCTESLPYGWPKRYRGMKAQWPIPDKILFWGSYWAEKQLRKGFWHDDAVLPLGNCRIDSFRSKLNLAKNLERSSSKDVVKLLFTTGGSKQRSEAIPFVTELLQQSETLSIPLMLYIKVHPWEGEDMAIYKAVQNRFPSRCVTFHPKEVSLYQLMTEVDIHFSSYSASIYESVGLGTPTAVLDWFDNSVYFTDLAEQGLVRVFTKVDEFIVCVKAALDNSSLWRQWVMDTARGRQFLFAENAVDSYVSFMNRITNSKV